MAVISTHNRYKFVTISIVKRLRNDHLTSETATGPRSGLKYPFGLLDTPVSTVIVFQGGDGGRG
jgi:hypothetical protein